VTPGFWVVVLPMLFALIAALNRQARRLRRRDCPVHLKRVNENFLNASVPALEPAKVKLNRRFNVHGARARLPNAMIGQDQIAAVLIVCTQPAPLSHASSWRQCRRKARRSHPAANPAKYSVPYPGSINRLSLDR
jgi:hypothetical protein